VEHFNTQRFRPAAQQRIGAVKQRTVAEDFAQRPSTNMAQVAPMPMEKPSSADMAGLFSPQTLPRARPRYSW
jgi:hypothetical protein